MKDVVLITNYWHFECEKASSRYRTLADLVIDAEMDLEIVTSTFMHLKKCQRTYSIEFLNSFAYKVKLIYEPGYKKNISFQRLISHRCFADNVIKYLKKRKRPDIIYCVVPSLDVAARVSVFANKEEIPLVIDIQDLWPEAFKMAINIPLLSDILFAPMLHEANQIYARADKIIAVSDTYRDRGLSVNKKDKEGLSVYIGTDFELIHKGKIDVSKYNHENEFWITYIGTLGHSYNIPLIIDAISLLKNEGIENVLLKVMGSGDLEEKFRQYAIEKNVKADFLGQTEYVEMMEVLSASEVAVNPIVGTSVSSIINKVSDYAAAGVPVINTQNSEEYRRILRQYNAGINCSSDDARNVANAIKTLYYDEVLRNKMHLGALQLGKQKFNRRVTYMKIVELLRTL